MQDRVYDFKQHVQTANEMDEIGKLPATFQTLNIPSRSFFVWDDVNRMLTLNGNQSRKKLNMHICPLQFDIVDRLIERFSNPDDLVYDPFAGLFTVPFRANLLNRRAIGTELNIESFRDGLFYLKKAEIDAEMPTLFKVEEDVI
jgi:DNA modification methylase